MESKQQHRVETGDTFESGKNIKVSHHLRLVMFLLLNRLILPLMLNLYLKAEKIPKNHWILE